MQKKIHRNSKIPIVNQTVERIEIQKEEPNIIRAYPPNKKEDVTQIKLNQSVNEQTRFLKNSSLQVDPAVAIASEFNGIIDHIKLELPDLNFEPVVFPDIEATFIGGYTSMQKFINDNIIYPQIPLQLGIQGKVYVEFIVEKDGSITNIRIARGVDNDLDKEAIRLIQKMPKWKAGEMKGKKVRTFVSLPFDFRIK